MEHFHTDCGCGPARGWERIARPIRKARNWSRDAWCWRRQGRPTDLPIVIKPGLLAACPHGHGLVTGWTWSVSRMTTNVIDADHLWEVYSATYPVERVRSVVGCGPCTRGSFTTTREGTSA